MKEQKVIEQQMRECKSCSSNAWTSTTYIDNSYDYKEIYKAIYSLPESQRKSLEMHLSGFKYSEIAQELRIPIGTVKSHIFISRKKLQELLRDFID